MKRDYSEQDTLKVVPARVRRVSRFQPQDAVSHSIYAERMLKVRPQRLLVRCIARAVCHVLVMTFQVLTAACRMVRGTRRPRGKSRSGARMVLTGTFFADSWIEAHVRPLALASRCEHIWVVADKPFVPLRHVSYVCPPVWLKRICGRVGARSLAFVWCCLVRRPDVVGGFHLLCNGLLAQLAARMIGARAMYFCVGGWAEFLNGAVHGGNRAFTKIGKPDPRLERRLLRSIGGFDLILTMGSKARQFMQERGIGHVPIEVMSGGIDHRRYGETSSDSQDKRYDLITVCRVEPVKRIDVLLEAVRQVAERLPEVKAVIVGDGADLDALKARAREMGLEQNVDFVGRHSDVERWLAASRIFVLTSDSEGLSLALMEAVTAGLPAIVSDVGDLADLVEDGVNGFRPPPQRPGLFAERICELLEDPQRYAAFSTAALESATAYRVETMRDRWDGMLQDWGFAALPGGAARMRRLAAGGWPSRKQLWEASRGMARGTAARTVAAIPPAVWLGQRFRKSLDFVQHSEHWDVERIASYQLSQMRRLVELAWNHSPYYRRTLRACGFEPADLHSLDDVARLPLLERSTVDASCEDLLTVAPGGARIDYVTTGGTGGMPLRFCIDRGRSTMEYAHLIASWQRAGYCLGLPLAVFRGGEIPLGSAGLHHTFDPLLRHHCYSSFHLSDDDIARNMQHIAGLGPCMLHVYPSVAAMLARWMQRQNYAAPDNIRGIIAESEIVYPQQRTLIEATFNCRLFACYGQSEKVVLGAACEHGSDYHIWPTYSYFELIDDAGRVVRTPGQRGEIVGSGFVNSAVPFIRYRTGDHATFVADRCADCGRQHTVIRDITGHRIQESLVLTDGSTLPWAALNVHDDTFRDVRRFQFVQHTPGRATLCVVPANGFGTAQRRALLDGLGRRLAGRLHIDLQIVDDIAASPRGKAIYVDQQIQTPSSI